MDLAGDGYDLDQVRRVATGSVIFSSPLVIFAYLLNRALGLPRAESPAARLLFLIATSALCSLAFVLFLESDFLDGGDWSDWLEITAAGCIAAAIATASRV